LHHANVDRMWSLWQDYGHQKSFTTFFLKSGGYQESGNRVGSLLWPWDGGFAHVEADALRVAIAHRVVGGEKAVTNGAMFDYRNLRISYDVVGGQLAVGTPVNSTISRFTSVAFNFQIPLGQAGHNFAFETSGSADLEMELYGPALCDNCYGDQRGFDDNSGSGGVNPRISLSLKDGNYTVVVRPHNPTDALDHIPFSISTTVVSTVQASPDQGKGKPLTLNHTYRASISAHGEVDWYHFIIPAGNPVPVVIESKGQLETVLVLYGNAPPKGIIDWNDNSGENQSAAIKKMLSPGLYHVAMRTSSNQFGNYTISVRD